MTMGRAEGLSTLVDEFMRATPDVEAAAVVSPDGLPMASALPPHLEEDRLSAMAAAMLSLGERAALNLGRGALNQIFVEGADGYVFLMSAGPSVLCAITRPTAKIGLVLYEMRRAGTAVAKILEQRTAEPVVATEGFQDA